MIEFSLDGKEFIPLCDLLKKVGLCESGGQAKAVVAQGLVKVGSLVELRKRCKIRVGQVAEYNDKKVKVVL